MSTTEAPRPVTRNDYILEPAGVRRCDLGSEHLVFRVIFAPTKEKIHSSEWLTREQAEIQRDYDVRATNETLRMFGRYCL